MSQEGYANLATNDGPRFHLIQAVPLIGRPGPKRCFLLRPPDSDRGPVGSLLIALLRLAWLEPTGAI